MAKILQAGVLYFALVFGVGFVLGPIRVLFVAPHFGERVAELLEMPVMVIVIIIAARWVTRHLAVPPIMATRLGVGSVALGLLLGAEFLVVILLRGVMIGEYVGNRDPIAGAAYGVMLGVFAVMPLIVSRR